MNTIDDLITNIEDFREKLKIFKQPSVLYLSSAELEWYEKKGKVKRINEEIYIGKTKIIIDDLIYKGE